MELLLLLRMTNDFAHPRIAIIKGATLTILPLVQQLELYFFEVSPWLSLGITARINLSLLL